MQYTDQNPGIRLAFVFLWPWRDQARRCIPGCYRTVPYQTPSTPVIHSHHPRSTRYHTNTPGPNPHGVPVSLSLRSLSLPPLAHLLLPVFPLFLFLFFFFFFFFFFFSFFSLLLTTGFSRNSASTSIAFSLSFGRHSRFLVSCLTAGAKRCVGFGPPSPFCASSLLCYIFYSPLFFA